jgi:cytochrome c553
MKKVMFALLAMALFSSLAFAGPVTAGKATSSGNAGSAIPTVDVLGAHNNYGRGCAGCHAPHSGAAGAGGNGIGGTTTDTLTGANALFAQDMGPLYGKTFDFSDISNSGSSNKYIFAAPAGLTGTTSQQYSDIRGIVMCLACHDGANAKGAMMQNQAYEQQIQALPSSYGVGKIPTLLGADGSTAGYNNDHPIGENATIAAVMGSSYGDGTNGLTYTFTGSGATQAIASVTAAGNYANFAADYGYPALAKGTYSYPTPVNAAGVPYLVCTTCHNQHIMNIYAATNNSKIAGAPTGTYATYFFVNGPYNVNNVAVPSTQAPSTTQFCRQCHVGEANEFNGAVAGAITTSF